MIKQTLHIINELKQRTRMPYPALCFACEIPYSSFIRWQKRKENQKPVYTPPGPKKVRPFSLDALRERIRKLKHGRKRTKGTGNVYTEYQGAISRRELESLVKQCRNDLNDEKYRGMRLIDWQAPGIVWSMDDTELGKNYSGKTFIDHMVMDVSARYVFPPLCGGVPKGKEVAENLELLFKRFGAPLFLKRDNAGNLNCIEVNKVLSKYLVIPLNSPAYYPPYNGSIEKANRMFKETMIAKFETQAVDVREHLQVYSEAAVHDMNHQSRDCLQKDNACLRFFTTKNQYGLIKRERRIAYEWIKSQTKSILDCMRNESEKAFAAAWRIAAETWLRMKGFISVSINGKVLPNFCPEKFHN